MNSGAQDSLLHSSESVAGGVQAFQTANTLATSASSSSVSFSSSARASEDTDHSISAGPRRGSFPAIMPESYTMPKPIISIFPGLTRTTEDGSNRPRSGTVTKADIQPTLSTSLAPKSGSLPSHPLMALGDVLTDSDPDYRHSKPAVLAPFPSTSVPSPHAHNPSQPGSTAASSPDDATIEVGASTTGLTFLNITSSTTPMMPPPAAAKSSSNKNRQYVLADGSVVSGKGLGRGRPGVKRGPRKPKSPAEQLGTDAVASVPQNEAAAVPATTQPLPPMKRKRADSEMSNIITSRSTSTSFSRDSSVEYTPTATQTRSGRSTHKPVEIVAAAPSTASPASNKKPRVTSVSTPTPASIKTHPKIKRRVYRGKEQSALCEHCQRGHGPPTNAIVFCDACNKCWHQQCHDPQIAKEVVTDVKAEWFCAVCDKILHPTKKPKKAAARTSLAEAPQVAPIAAAVVPTKVASTMLTHEQRKIFLDTLPKDRLVALLLRASQLAPNMSLFEAPNPNFILPAPIPITPAIPVWAPSPGVTSSYVTPVSNPNPFIQQQTVDPPDEGYDDYIDEHAALYPKPGNGVKLPPESADLHMLLEGPDCKTFSHWVRPMVPPSAGMGMAPAMNVTSGTAKTVG